ncbi:hypothetical protein NXX09_15900 [Bacteroides uniformis]|nr:hypothetical protein [Bacteroides uniformis]
MFDSNVLHIAEFMTVAKSLPHLLQKVRKLLIPKLFLSYSCIFPKKIGGSSTSYWADYSWANTTWAAGSLGRFCEYRCELRPRFCVLV